MTATSPTSFGMVNPVIFEHLQAKIDEDAHVREELRDILQILERQGRARLSFMTGSAILILQRKSNTISISPGAFHTFGTAYDWL